MHAYHQEMASLAEAGCSYVQIDETSLVKLGDPRVRQLLAERGDDWQDLLRSYVAVINAVVAGAPAGMTIGLHVCRSQDPSWQANVGYDAIAEPLFNDIKVGIYFLEYDNARSGDFAPLRLVPPGKFVVLGLVATQAQGGGNRRRRSSDASTRRATTSASSSSRSARNAASPPALPSTSPSPKISSGPSSPAWSRSRGRCGGVKPIAPGLVWGTE